MSMGYVKMTLKRFKGKTLKTLNKLENSFIGVNIGILKI